MTFQRTLKSPVTLFGIGLHSGKSTSVVLKPARPHFGIRFIRTDLAGAPQIAAHYKNVISTQLATSLGSGSASVSTVEHVLSALQGAGIDNALIEVSGSEVPIMDGSAAPFYNAILAAGFTVQGQPRSFLSLRRKVEVKYADKFAVAEPSSRLEIMGSIDWNHPAIGYQEFHYVEGRSSFSELASARTFCMLKDVEAMKRKGLAQGGSLENAVVLDDTGVLNSDGLRMQDEFVRHKILDALGDFKLAGIPMRGYFRLHRAGHDLHRQLLNAIFRDPDNFEIIDESMLEIVRPGRLSASIAHGLVASLS